MSKVYIEHRKVRYPNYRGQYAPSQYYPEYKWDDISGEKNEVYDMIRECLYRYGLDSDHFNTPKWNPMGDFIHPGDTVLIKPNWVEDKNENKSGGLECLVTNASIIRAIIDYVYLAIKDTGHIIVGDSAMPDCNLSALMKNAHYDVIWKSCEDRGIHILVKDFREDIVSGFANSVTETNGDNELIIDLDSESMFSTTEYNVGKYRNGIVDATKMNEFYHSKGHHRYGVSKIALQADVIINLSKPKTHRKAGYTAALKNYIGICSKKISIPHNVMGNIKEGGDTYYGPKYIFETEQQLRDIQNKLQTAHKNSAAIFIKCLRIPFWIFRKITHKYFFGTGNWYKNDTIWRSILDLNRIVIYADKSGKMRDVPQRKFFNLGDMIIAGHKNGPLAPSPMELGVLLCSDDPVAFDLTVINLMGLNYKYLPVLNKIPEIVRYPILKDECNQFKIFSNDSLLNDKNITDMPIGLYGFFEPADGWKIISLRNKDNESNSFDK